jgi:hypothetical protein
MSARMAGTDTGIRICHLEDLFHYISLNEFWSFEAWFTGPVRTSIKTCMLVFQIIMIFVSF